MGKSIESRVRALEEGGLGQGPQRIFVRWPDGRLTIAGEPTDEQPGPDDYLMSVIYGERPGAEAPDLADDNKALGGAR